PLFDVFSYDIPAQRNDRRMADDAFVEYRDVGRTTADIDQYNACILICLVKHGFGRGQWFKNQILHLQRSVVYTFFNVFDSADKSGYDMEVCFHAATGHTNGILYPRLIIDGKLLRQHVDDLFARRKHELIHVFDKPFDIHPVDFTVVPAGKDTPVLNAFDVLTGNANIDDFDIHI